MQNSKHKESQHFCINCLQGFAEKKSRDEHLIYCRNNEAVRIEMPNSKPIVQYLDGQYQFKVSFMMYADFESILEPIQGVNNNPNESSNRGVYVHMPSGCCVYSHCSYGNVTNPLTQYRGPDCVHKFCKHIISKAKRLYNSFPEKPMAPLTKSQLKKYKRVTKCHICFKPFSEKKRKEINVTTAGSTEELRIPPAIYNIRSQIIYQSYFTISLDMMLTFSKKNCPNIQRV